MLPKDAWLCRLVQAVLGPPRNGGHLMVSSQGSEVTNGDEDPAIIRGRVQTGGGVTADIEWSTGDAGGERVGYSTFDAASLAR